MNRILANWGIQPSEIRHLHPSAWLIDGTYLFKHGKCIGEMEKSVLLSRLLREEGLPVARYLPTADGRPFLPVKNGYWCLMPKLPGAHASVFEQGESFACELGGIIARLHIALKQIEPAVTYEEADLLRELQGDVLPFLRKKRLPVPAGLLEELQDVFNRDYAALPRQLIHRDVHMENLLFEGGALTGYIDFDLSVSDARIFDLCYFTLSTLPGRTVSDAWWRQFVRRVAAGYASLLPLTEAEKDFIPYLSLYIELLFAVYWAKAGNTGQTEEALRLVNWLWAHRKAE